MAVRFSAINTYLYRTSGLPSLATFTWMGWVYLTTDRDAESDLLVISDGTNFFTFGLSTDGTTLWVFTSTGYTGGSSLSTGTWYHLALVKSGSSITVYVNGVSNITRTDAISFTPGAILMGSNGAAYFINGRLAALKIWSGTALSQAEVQAEMRTIRPHHTTNLYGWYPMFPGASERVRDYSGNGRNLSSGGTLTDEDPPPLSWGGLAALIGALPNGIVHQGAAALAGTATITAGARLMLRAAVAISGDSALAPASRVIANANAVLTGQATLSSSARSLVGIAAALVGEGSLAAGGRVLLLGAASLSGQGAITAAALLSLRGAAALSGAASLSPTSRVIFAAVAALSGQSDLAAGARRLLLGAAALSGESSTGAAARMILSAIAALTGQATLTGITQGQVLGAATLSGESSLSASSRLLIGLSASLAGQSSISAGARLLVGLSVSLTGQAALDSSARILALAAAALSGESSLAAASRRLAGGGAALSGQSGLAAVPTNRMSGASALISAALLVAMATVTRPTTGQGQRRSYSASNRDTGRGAPRGVLQSDPRAASKGDD